MTWRQIKRIAYGEMGLSEAEFGRITPEYFMLRLQGMRYAQRLNYRNDWIRARWQVCVILNTKTKRELREIDLRRFPWEQPEVIDWKKISNALPKTIPNGAFEFKRPLKIASFGNNTELPEA